jgi:hypothetical protein
MPGGDEHHDETANHKEDVNTPFANGPIGDEWEGDSMFWSGGCCMAHHDCECGNSPQDLD